MRSLIPRGGDHRADLLVLGVLAEQLRQDRAVHCPAVVCVQTTRGTVAAGSELDGPDVRGGRIHGQMHLELPRFHRRLVSWSQATILRPTLSSRKVLSASAGGICPIGPSRRRLSNRATRFSVSHSTAPAVFKGPRRWMTCGLERPDDGLGQGIIVAVADGEAGTVAPVGPRKPPQRPTVRGPPWASRSAERSDGYCPPRSERWVRPSPGRRAGRARSRASAARQGRARAMIPRGEDELGLP